MGPWGESVCYFKAINNSEEAHLESPEEVHLQHGLLLLQQHPPFAVLIDLDVDLVQADVQRVDFVLKLQQLPVLDFHQTFWSDFIVQGSSTLKH